MAMLIYRHSYGNAYDSILHSVECDTFETACKFGANGERNERDRVFPLAVLHEELLKDEYLEVLDIRIQHALCTKDVAEKDRIITLIAQKLKALMAVTQQIEKEER